MASTTTTATHEPVYVVIFGVRYNHHYKDIRVVMRFDQTPSIAEMRLVLAQDVGAARLSDVAVTNFVFVTAEQAIALAGGPPQRPRQPPVWTPPPLPRRPPAAEESAVGRCAIL